MVIQSDQMDRTDVVMAVGETIETPVGGTADGITTRLAEISELHDPRASEARVKALSDPHTNSRSRILLSDHF